MNTKKYIRIAFLMTAVSIFGMANSAQIPLGNKNDSYLGFNIEKVERVGKDIVAEVTVDFSKVKLSSTKEVTLTPMWVGDNETVKFEPFTVAGKSIYFYEIRNYQPTQILFKGWGGGKGETSPQTGNGRQFSMGDGTKTSFSVDGNTTNFTYQTPYQPWMEKACFSLSAENSWDEKILTYNLIETDFTPKGYEAEYVYITPVAEAAKIRELSSRAYIDFKVNKTDIDPYYRNNPRELAKIFSTIDSVRNDKDITVRSLHINGTASPEGSYENNVKLASGRTMSLMNYVQSLYHFPYGFITTSFEPVDWQGLREFLEKYLTFSLNPMAGMYGGYQPYNQIQYNQPVVPYNQPAAPYNQPAAPYNQPVAPYNQAQPIAPYNQSQPVAPYNQPVAPYNQAGAPYNQAPYNQPVAPYNQQNYQNAQPYYPGYQANPNYQANPGYQPNQGYQGYPANSGYQNYQGYPQTPPYNQQNYQQNNLPNNYQPVVNHPSSQTPYPNVNYTELPHASEILAIVNSNLEPQSKNNKIRSAYPKEYKWLLNNIYPLLRHSDYRIEFEIKSFTDVNEIIAIMNTQPQKLSLAELFTAANSQGVGSELFTRAFEVAVNMFPDDETANFNAGMAAVETGDYDRAKQYFSKSGNGPEVKYAYALIEALQGNNEEAYQMFLELKYCGSPEIEKNAANAVLQLSENNNDEGNYKTLM